MKKLLSVLMASAVLLSAGAFSGCGDGKAAPEPTYASEDIFDVGMWVGVSDKITYYDEWGSKTGEVKNLTNEEFLAAYELIAESGVNIAYPGYEYMLWGTQDYNMKCLWAAHEVGIRQLITIPAMNDYFTKLDTLLSSGVETEEQAVEKVRNYLKPYVESEYADAFYGCFIGDEPGASKYNQHSVAQRIFQKAAPDLCYYVNLFPVIAGGAQLSGGDGSITYDEYIGQYLEKIKTPYISYDHYPLYKVGRQYSLEESFLQNMEIIRNAVDEEGEDREIWTFLQSIQYGSRNRALECVGDASFQVFSFMAYGGDGVQWFCFTPPPPSDGATRFENNSPLDREYQKTPTFDYVKAANSYAQAMMPYYANFTWKGLMTSSEDGGEGNFERITRTESTNVVSNFSATEDAIAGVFEDKDGREGFMLVNFTDPARKIDTKITMKVKGVHNAIVVLNGEKKIVPVKKGKLTIELKSGEGAFVIPY